MTNHPNRSRRGRPPKDAADRAEITLKLSPALIERIGPGWRDRARDALEAAFPE